VTPTVGWTEQDYYRASRAARRAWEKRADQQQIPGVLDEQPEGAGLLVEPAGIPTLPARRRARPGARERSSVWAAADGPVADAPLPHQQGDMT
jgi:hypothetical protein